MKLKDKADMPVPEPGQPAVAFSFHLLTVDHNAAIKVSIHGRQKVKQRGFSAARLAGDRHKLPCSHLKANIFQYLGADRFVEKLI